MFPNASALLKNIHRAPEILRCARETSQWPQITSSYLGFSKLTYPALLRLRGGDSIRLQELTDLKTFWQIFLRQIYRVDASDRIILDLGANIGLFTLYSARRAPAARIFAIEPFPANFERLLETVREHDLTGRVTCLKCAITGKAGMRLMYDGPLPSQQRFLVAGGKSASGTPVQGITLCELFRQQALNKIDLLKIDVEGSEYEVLLSATPDELRIIRRIALEYHGDCAPHSKVQIFDHLRKAGFRLIWDIQDRLGYGVAEVVQ
jgi:FkbM family methyltransferase